MIIEHKGLSFVVVCTAFLYAILTTIVCAEPKVGVIIPELRAPFNAIYDSVGSGIDDGLKNRSSKILLEKDFDIKSINRWVKKEKIEAVIALGGIGQKASVFLPENVQVVLGALLASPGPMNKIPGVALTPDPGSLFALLKRLDNKVNKVIVVYNTSSNQWLIDLAKRQSVENGVQLVAYQATDIKQAAIIYHGLFESNELNNTAFWLLQDRKVVDSKIVLPFILEEAWQKRIVVFSSALSHVKKGVLFSMYPDNRLHGKQLAELLINESLRATPSENGLYPTEGLQDAVNSRTAEHLGINISRSELRKFDVVFPLSN